MEVSGFHFPQLLDIVTSNQLNSYIWICSYKEIKCWRRINPLTLALCTLWTFNSQHTAGLCSIWLWMHFKVL